MASRVIIYMLCCIGAASTTYGIMGGTDLFVITGAGNLLAAGLYVFAPID